MLKIFQANSGSFIQVNEDILPSQKVSELWEEVSVSLGVGSQDVILMTLEGQLMDKLQIIASYTSGTSQGFTEDQDREKTKTPRITDEGWNSQKRLSDPVEKKMKEGKRRKKRLLAVSSSKSSLQESKPILVFVRPWLHSTSPPRLKAGNFQDILRHKSIDEVCKKPHALLQVIQEFERQGESVTDYYDALLKGQDLQVRAWKAVQKNCNSTLETFRNQMNCLKVEFSEFQKNVDTWRQHLRDFPQSLKLLKEVLVPSSLSAGTNGSTDLTLYEWISRQDPNSNLQEFAGDCEKTLDSLFTSSHVEELLAKSKEIVEAVDSDPDSIPGWSQRYQELQRFGAEQQELLTTQLSLAKTAKVTMENALKSGEKSLLIQLKETQKQTLVMMVQNDQILRQKLQVCLDSRRNLVINVHKRLQWITEIQEGMSETSKKGLFAREQLKLIKKKMSILGKICESPQILVEIMGEIIRRKESTEAIRKLTTSLDEALQEWKTTEKERRRHFLNDCGDHFLIKLFPGANEKPFSPRVMDGGRLALSVPELDSTEAKSMVTKLPKSLADSFWNRTQLLLPDLFKTGSSVSQCSDLSEELPVNPGLEGSLFTSASEDNLLNLKSKSDAVAFGQELARGEIQKLEKEVSLLMSKVIKLESENDSLRHLKEERSLQQKEIESLKQSTLESCNAIAQLTRELELVNTARTCLKDQATDLEATLSTLKREKALAMEQGDEATRQKCDAIEQKDVAIGQRDEAIKERDEAIKQRDEAIKQRNDFQLEKDEEMQRSFGMSQKVIDDYKVHLEKLNLERASLAEEIAYLKDCSKEEQMRLLKQKQTLEEKVGGLEVQLKDVSSTHEKLLAEHLVLKKENSTLEMDLQKSKSEIAEKTEKLSAAVRQLDATSEKELLLTEQLNKLAMQLKTVKTALVHTPSLDSGFQEFQHPVEYMDHLLTEASVLSEGIASINNTLIQTENSNIDLRDKLQRLEDGSRQTRQDYEEIRLQLERTSQTLQRRIEALEEEKKAILAESLQKQEALKQSSHEITKHEAYQKKSEERLQNLMAEFDSLRAELEKRSLERQQLQKELHINSERCNCLEEKLKRSQQENLDLSEKVVIIVEENKNLKEKLQECKEKQKKMLAQKKRLEDDFKESKSQYSALSDVKVALTSRVKELENDVDSLKNQLEDSKKDSKSCYQELERSKQYHKDQVREITELKEKYSFLRRELTQKEFELDQALKERMELERDKKELQRSMDKSTTEDQVKDTKGTAMALSVYSEVDGDSDPTDRSSITVKMNDLMPGDTAVFVASKNHITQKDNYIALTFDKRLYYIEAESVKSFKLNLASESVAFGKSSKGLYIGRIKTKTLQEVRKADNRFNLPVKSKIWKVEAEEVTLT